MATPGSMSEQPPIFTVGHSTRSIAEFVDVLRTGRVDLVVDVRTVPKSRRNPQYHEDVIAAELEPYQIAYARIAELGGLRARSHDVDPALNGYWDNQSFHNYADYALSHEFDEALGELVTLHSERRCAIMCAEAVWWRCHRRIIADHLLVRGIAVQHLMGPGRAQPAKLTPGALAKDGSVTYPAQPPRP